MKNNNFKKIFLSLDKQGFSLVELLTVIAIISILSVMGIRSYQAQTNKARTLEAKHSLSYVYKAEKQFRDLWGTYHENLLAIGAIPDGSYHYDVGFKVTKADISKDDGELKQYPLPESLDVVECTDFRRMCDDFNGCLEKIISNLPADSTDYGVYFNPRSSTDPHHSISSGCKVKAPYVTGHPTAHTHVSVTAEADETTFKAVAIGKLKDVDLWSIDEKKIFQHVKDGTE